MQLRDAGVQVDLGVCAEDAGVLIAPFRKRVETGCPWVIAKWAMTLDGKIATHTGHSQWISSAASREIVHDFAGAWTPLSWAAELQQAMIRI